MKLRKKLSFSLCLFFYIFLIVFPCRRILVEAHRGLSPTSALLGNNINHLINVDISKKFSTTQFTYESDSESNTRLYTVVDPYLIDKVTRGNKIIWDSADHENHYGSQVYIGYNDDGERIFRVYFPEDLIDFSANSKPAKPSPPRTPERAPSPPKLPKSKYINTNEPILITLDLQVRENTHEYTFKKDPKTERMKFTCRPGYLINKVVKSGVLISECENKDFFDRVIIFRDQNNERKVRVLFPGEIDFEDPVEPFPKFDVSKSAGSSESDIVEIYKSYKSSKNSVRPKFVSVDIKNKESTDGVDYFFDSKSKTHTFSPKRSRIINIVNRGLNNIYTHESGEYPEKVLIFPGPDGKPVLRIQFPEAESKSPPRRSSLAKRSREPSVEDILAFAQTLDDHLKTSSKTPIELDIDSQSGSQEFYRNFNSENNMVTFIPKNNFQFSSVVTSISDDNSRYVVWKTTDPKEYASKVDFITYTHFNEHELSITLANGSVKKFVNSKLVTWKEIDPNVVFPVTVNILSEHNSYKYTNILEDNIRYISSKPEFLFNRIIELNIANREKFEIWSTDNHQEFVNNLEFDLKKNNLMIYLENGNRLFFRKNSDGVWNQVSADSHSPPSSPQSTFTKTHSPPHTPVPKLTHTPPKVSDFGTTVPTAPIPPKRRDSSVVKGIYQDSDEELVRRSVSRKILIGVNGVDSGSNLTYSKNLRYRPSKSKTQSGITSFLEDKNSIVPSE